MHAVLPWNQCACLQVLDHIEGVRGQLMPWEGLRFLPTDKRSLGVFRVDTLKLLHRDPSQRPSMAEFCDTCNRVLAGTTLSDC